MSKNVEAQFREVQDGNSGGRIIIIGGGIVGSCLAYSLSQKASAQVILLDDSLSDPQGSTAFAPGFVGQLNTVGHLTQMAKETVEEYSKIPGM